MENIALAGIGLGALAIGVAIGLVVHGLAMWFVARFLLGVPDVSFWRCYKTVAVMLVVSVLMVGLLYVLLALLPLGLLIVVPWFIVLLLALKATIEGGLEITEGGWLILILFVLIQATINYLLREAA